MLVAAYATADTENRTHARAHPCRFCWQTHTRHGRAFPGEVPHKITVAARLRDSIDRDGVRIVGVSGERFSWWRPDCVADDAVICEPVSSRQISLLTGKLTGNFAESGPLLRFWRPIMSEFNGFQPEFPTQRNREFANAYQGIFSEEQGNLINRSGSR
jgi:hypothetical protein